MYDIIYTQRIQQQSADENQRLRVEKNITLYEYNTRSRPICAPLREQRSGY